MKTRKFILGMVLAIAIGAAIVLFLNRPSDNWKSRTSPLPKTTIEALCKNLSLSREDRLCNGSREVFARDFYEVIRQKFRPEDEFGTKPSDAATYQDVENILGQFRWQCEAATYLPKSGYSYYRCLYDLRGDKIWNLAFYYYYPSNALFSIRAGSSDD